jgi:hypothetical protein
MMTRQTCSGQGLSKLSTTLILALLMALGAAFTPLEATAQSTIPCDRYHVSVTLGGHFLLGVGYTRWIEDHHALEFTVFPFAYPGEGFPFGVRGGYAWVPSDESWRAKLGGNFTLLISPGGQRSERFTPLLAFTPGIQYEPDKNYNIRADLWMSYFLNQKVFAPMALEILSGFKG